MANYLERVASSAGSRAALTKPQMSVPPLLPAGNQLLSAEDSLPADNPFFEETSHAQAARPGSSPAKNPAETPRFQNKKLGPVAEAGSAKQPDVSATRSQTSDNSAPANLSTAAPAPSTSDAPFTIHLPKTLRPASANSTQPVAKEEPRGDAAALTRAQPAAARATADEEVSPVAQSAALVIKEFEPSKARTDRLPARPEAQAADTSTVDTDKRQTPAFAPLPSITHQPEPLSAGLPVQIPPVIVPNAGRQEQSRVSIGLLEVMVNNQPPVAPVGPPAQPPLQNGNANLARRYLDRFALRR